MQVWLMELYARESTGYFLPNSIPSESFWLNVKRLTNHLLPLVF